MPFACKLCILTRGLTLKDAFHVLRFDATCFDCGRSLSAGTTARWFGRGQTEGDLQSHLRSEHGIERQTGLEADKFVRWWREDPERAKCTLEQAIGAYCSTFPGRLHALLVELLEFVR